MALLKLDSIGMSYWHGPSEKPVLKGVSLEVHAGRLTAVYGQRDAGKSTLLRIAAGFDAPDTGTVTFAGTPLPVLSRRRLAEIHRHEIAWVERGGPPHPATPMRLHIGMPLYRSLGTAEADRRVDAALAVVGAPECAEQRWADLSDASRMLVAIAQALVREPRVLLVDDPTAGLGIIERERVAGLLRTLAEEREIAVLMAAPDMPAMLHAHEVRSLSRGRLVAPAERPAPGGEVLDFRRPRSA